MNEYKYSKLKNKHVLRVCDTYLTRNFEVLKIILGRLIKEVLEPRIDQRQSRMFMEVYVAGGEGTVRSQPSGRVELILVSVRPSGYWHRRVSRTEPWKQATIRSLPTGKQDITSLYNPLNSLPHPFTSSEHCSEAGSTGSAFTGRFPR